VYFLADGIYPDYSMFVKTFTGDQRGKALHFAERHESVRKDVERCFGVLIGRFHILANPGRLWSPTDMAVVWKACICLHNMIIQDEPTPPVTDCPHRGPSVTIIRDRPTTPLTLDEYMDHATSVYDPVKHFELRSSLVNHLWELKGQE